jgi:hypothetical protein
MMATKLEQKAPTLTAVVPKIEMLAKEYTTSQQVLIVLSFRRHDVGNEFRNACLRTKNNSSSPPNVSINAAKPEITRDAKAVAPSTVRN